MAALLLVAISIASCSKKEEPIPEQFTFTINGQNLDLSSNISVGKDLFDELNIEGKTTGVGIVEIEIANTSTGSFDQSDASDAFLEADYDLTYIDGNNNSYFYRSNDVNSNFNINVNKFENREDGEVSGTFSGTLFLSILSDDSTAVDSVVITNGIFSTTLDQEI